MYSVNPGNPLPPTPPASNPVATPSGNTGTPQAKAPQPAPGNGVKTTLAFDAIQTQKQNMEAYDSTSITPRTQEAGKAVDYFSGVSLDLTQQQELNHVADRAKAIVTILYQYPSMQSAPSGPNREIELILSQAAKDIVDERKTAPQSVIRIAIDPQYVTGIPNFYKVPDHLKRLHAVEYCVFTKALELIQQAGNDTVVMDIFAFDKDGKVRFDNGRPETHSVTLWHKGIIDPQKKPNEDYIVLFDPSNSNFSARLKTAYEALKLQEPNNPNFSFIFIEAFSPKPKKPEKMYHPGPSPALGYSDVQATPPSPRDCIDIAVKIAFEIQVQLIVFKIKAQLNPGTTQPAIGQMIEQATGQVVSNHTKLNDSLILLPTQIQVPPILLRSMQTSSPDLRGVIAAIGLLDRQIVVVTEKERQISHFLNELLNSVPSSSAAPISAPGA